MARKPGSCLAAVGVFALALSGCTAAPPDPEQYVGDTLSVAMQHLQSPNVIDLSANVANLPPTYNQNQDNSTWVVVVGCYEDNPEKTSNLGVIPSTAATSSVIANAKDGKYDQYVPACSP